MKNKALICMVTICHGDMIEGICNLSNLVACGETLPRIASSVTQKGYDIRPQRTVDTSGRQIPYSFKLTYMRGQMR